MHNWERLFAHSHWFTLHIFGGELHLCARCSGVVLGFISTKILFTAALASSYSTPFPLGLLISLLLALPAMVDWATQNMGFRQSSNNLRLTTGFLEGLGVGFFGLTEVPALVKYLILTTIGLAVLCVGVLGQRLLENTLRR